MNNTTNSRMMDFFFRSGELSSKLNELSSLDIQQLSVRDPAVTGSKQSLLHFISEAAVKVPHIMFDFTVSVDIIDREVLRALSDMYCSLTLPVEISNVPALKKNLTKKAAMLNDAGLVFGFDLECNVQPSGFSVKTFREALDFIVTLYPNHLYFSLSSLRSSPSLSPADIKKIELSAYAAEVFYTKGRAVPWFLLALKPLKITASVFFSDFSEWLSCNNAAVLSPSPALFESHKEIEKMQLVFLQLKYEEKRMQQVYTALSSVIRIHGAFSRVVAENEETVISLDYNPDDLLGSDVFDIVSFAENVCMEESDVKIFAGEFGPDFICCS